MQDANNFVLIKPLQMVLSEQPGMLLQISLNRGTSTISVWPKYATKNRSELIMLNSKEL